MRKSSAQQRYERSPRPGTAATEFAIVLPLMLLFAFASMDFGRIAYYAEVVSNAARSGAEVGATRRFNNDTRASWEANVHQAIRDEMHNVPNFNETRLESNISTFSDGDGLVRVTVDVTYPFATVVTWPLLPSQVRLHSRIQFRQFR